MSFLKVFLRGLALLPSVVQGVETLYGAKAGSRKRRAAVTILGAAIDAAGAVDSTKIADAAKFTAGLGVIVDGAVACLNASAWAKPA